MFPGFIFEGLVLLLFIIPGWFPYSEVPADPSLLLREPFSRINTDRWNFKLPDGATARIENGALLIRAGKKYAEAVLLPSRNWKSYELKLRFRIRSLKGKRNSLGVGLRSDSSDAQFYRYDADRHSIRGFGKTIRHARVPRNNVHTLRVERKANRITASIDGSYALTHREASGIDGAFVVRVRQMHVEFQHLIVQRNPEETASININFDEKGTPGPSWPDIVGPHHPDLYSSFPPGTQWRYFLRYWPHHSFGPSMDVTDDPDREELATYRLTGPFSGERRWLDFTVPTQTSGNLRGEVARGHEAGYETSPGLTEDLVPEMRADKRATQDLIYGTIRYFNEERPGGSPVRYWRFGLEMNGVQKNKPYLTGIDWSQHGRWYMNNSRETALNYVRWLLAPGAAAAKKASEDVYGTSNRIKVVLGTVANFDNPGAVRFVRTILNRKLTEKDAPSLRGDRMWEHLDVVSANFFLHETPWRDRLNWLYEKYMKPGKIEGIWVTALGRAGNGAWHVLLTSARFLSWSCGKYGTPNALRLFFWGENIESHSGPGRLAVKYLADVLKDGSLKNYSDHVSVDRNPDIRPETYALSSQVGQNTINYILVARAPAPLTVKRLSIKGVSTGVDPKQNKLRLRVWPTDARPQEITPESVRRKNGELIVTLNRPLPAETQLTCVIRTDRSD